MIYFVLWISISGHWFLGPDYKKREDCEAYASAIRKATTGVEVVCAPRGMP